MNHRSILAPHTEDMRPILHSEQLGLVNHADGRFALEPELVGRLEATAPGLRLLGLWKGEET